MQQLIADEPKGVSSAEGPPVEESSGCAASLCLELAGLSFVMELESEDMVAPLMARFGHFVHRGVPAQAPVLTLRVLRKEDPMRAANWRWEPPVSAVAAMGIATPRPLFTKLDRAEDGRVFVDMPSCYGHYDGDAFAEMTMTTTRTEFLVPAFLLTILPDVLLRHQRVLIHASGVLHEGQAYLFSGPSGAGKTTAAWHSPEQTLLNDELVILSYHSDAPYAEQFFAHGTPFYGKWEQLGEACSGPLFCIHFLAKTPTNSLSPLSHVQQFRRLCQVLCFRDPLPSTTAQLLAIADALCGRCRLLSWSPKLSLWDFLSSPEHQHVGLTP